MKEIGAYISKYAPKFKVRLTTSDYGIGAAVFFCIAKDCCQYGSSKCEEGG